LRGLGVAPGIGNIVAQQRYITSSSGVPGAAVTHYYHPNHRGDTAYLTDASGVKAASYVYDAFGRMLTDNASSLTDYRFSGKEWDADAQLYYFGFRWYDPDSGTWMTKDTLRLSVDYNSFRYCFGDPVIFVDSYGYSGTITVYARDGHSWIRYDSDTGTRQQYGTNMDEGFKVVEASIPTPDAAARASHINDTQESSMKLRLMDFCASGKNAWWLLFPCSHFAAEIWKAATGESLSDRTLGISTPGKLAESIRRANVADANSSLHYTGNNTFTYTAN
jgi:RHS repeat-associated protein